MAPAVRRFAAWGAAAVVLAATFALYLRPDIAVLVAESFWACFGV